MKKIITTLLFVSLCIFFVQSQPVKEHGKLSVKGINLVDQNNEVFMLQGVSYGWHNFWPRFYNKESVKWLRDDWSCSVIRAAMGVEPA
ncbi:MAG: hypothetical protein JXR31_16165, partial [Prolixibacteraceae bacterium]|nr:hypothetical protein [Prolixibacteraceae bacterium]